MSGGNGYSQFGEEPIVLDFFRSATGRRFLDIGAHDGISCSNTRRLAELGWGGTLVEPSPAAFARLMSVYGDQPGINLVNAGIIPGRTRVLPFFDTGGTFVSSFDEKHRDEWEGKPGVHFRPMYVVGCNFRALFEGLPGPYHFVSIDVEGTNVQLFRELFAWLVRSQDDWPWLNTELICVEHQGHVDELVAHAETGGFRVHAKTEANLLLARREVIR